MGMAKGKAGQAMTLARQLIEAWAVRQRTFGVYTLAKKLDPKVKRVRAADGEAFTYIFSDGSVAKTEARGQAFKIWAYGGK
jgi:hypothetical protein